MRFKTILIIVFSAFLLTSGKPVKDCKYKGVNLYGRVKVVTHHADFRIKVVERHPDLRVLQVGHHADACGRWMFVEHHPDFTVQFVEHHPDFTIQFVEHHPSN